MITVGRTPSIGNKYVSLLDSVARAATTTVECENVHNKGGAFIINVSSAGDVQVETATVVATITLDGNIDVIVTSGILVGSPLLTTVAVSAGDDASAVAGKIRTALNLISAITDDYIIGGIGAEVILTAIVIAANDATLNIDVHFTASVGTVDDTTSADTTAGAAVLQVETATSAGTITTSGNLEVIVTGGLVAGSPLTIPVAVLDTDDTSAVATKIRTALSIAAITDDYTVGGATTAIILTTIAFAANDATLNIDVHNDTSVGYTDAVTSVNTTAGAAVLQVETATVVGAITTGGYLSVISTGVNVVGSPLTTQVEVVASDSANTVAGKIRTALGVVTAITDSYTVSGATDEVILTNDTVEVNDATLNIDVHITTDIGLTDDTSSVDTTVGDATIDVTPKIEGRDPINNIYYTILTGVAITAAGTTVLRIYPELTAIANVTAKDLLPNFYRLTMTHGDAVATQYSVVLNSN